MRLVLTGLAWFVAGCLAGLFVAPLLFSLWSDLVPRWRGAEWLAQNVSYRAAGYWGLVWLRIPDAMLLAAAGVIGGLFVRRRPILMVSLFAAAFVLARGIAGYEFLFAFGVWIAAQVLAWEVGVAGLAPIFALLVIRLRRRGAGRGFEVQPPPQA